jgi:hypothetical protein
MLLNGCINQAELSYLLIMKAAGMECYKNALLILPYLLAACWIISFTANSLEAASGSVPSVRCKGARYA